MSLATTASTSWTRRSSHGTMVRPSGCFDLTRSTTPSPPAGDGDTDIVDLQFVFGRNGGVCEIVKSHSEQFDGAPTEHTGIMSPSRGHAHIHDPARVPRLRRKQPSFKGGVETCINALGFGGDTTDWDYFGQLDPSRARIRSMQAVRTRPASLTVSGVTPSGAMLCHTWMNAAYPTLNETQPTGAGGATFGYVGCFMLTPPDFCGPFGS